MRRILPLAIAVGMAAVSAKADPFVDAVVENFRALGYEYIEITQGPTQIEAEGVRGTRKLEVVYDRATGRILEPGSRAGDRGVPGPPWRRDRDESRGLLLRRR